jgi:hypothetical protein
MSKGKAEARDMIMVMMTPWEVRVSLDAVSFQDKELRPLALRLARAYTEYEQRSDVSAAIRDVEVTIMKSPRGKKQKKEKVDNDTDGCE